MVFNIDFGGKGKEFMTNIIVLIWIFVSGIIFAITYFIVDTIHKAFLTVDCLVPQNVYFDTCQEWFAMTMYPFFELRYLLIFMNYFAIFGLVFALFFMGFRTKKHPVLLVVHIVTSIIFGYFSIEIANIYRLILQNPQMYAMLTQFPIYNKIMLYFPQFMFFVIFVSGLIGFFGIFKSVGQFNQGVGDLG